MTPNEKVHLAGRIEPLERERAKERQRASGPASVAKREGHNDGSGQFPEIDRNGDEHARGEARDIVAHAVGMSGATYSRAAAVVAMALEELERPKAEARMKATQAKPGQRVGSVKFTEPTNDTPRPPVRDIVGKAVGLSGPAFHRVKAVIA